MAPQKRTRNGDDEVIAVESATSRLRGEIQQKRARISMADSSSRRRREASSPIPSDDQNVHDNDSDEEDEGISIPPGTQYEMMRDAGFKHLDHADEDDEIATQHLLASTQRAQLVGEANHASDNAVIEELTCINFMNHERLHIKLGPLINFIVGMNGSGKSAVLTGLTLCLGGKPASTNRGTSMKSLIKNGTDQGMLIVKLKNQGESAYQPELYGKSIIVERHFNERVGGNYKLKSANGRIISTKKSDLDDIVEYFQLQVDNPMNILTQDEAKTFIKDSTPAMKYQFFVKGVQLEQLDNDYRLLSETCDSIERHLKDSADDYQYLEKKFEDAQAKQRILAQSEGMRLAKKNLIRQLTWCQVAEQENELEARRKNVADIEQNIGRQERVVGERDQHFEAMNNKVLRAEEKLQAHNVELEPLKEQERAAKSDYDLANGEVQTLHTQQREIKASLKQATDKAAGIKTQIDEEQKRIEDANGGAHSRKLTEVEEAREIAVQAKRAFDDTHGEMQQLKEASQAAKAAVSNSQGPLDAKRQEVKMCENHVSSLQNGRHDPMQGFERDMPRLLKMIADQSGRFKEMPVGPIGLHLKLRDPKWSDILEKILNAPLNGFVVTNQQDLETLQRMMSQAGVKFSNIFKTSRGQIDTSRNEPDAQFMTISRVLEISDELARNTLIINYKIEQMILVEKYEEAMRVMQPGSLPTNVEHCYTINPSRRGYGIKLTLTGPNKQNSASDFVKPLEAHRKPRMHTDSDRRLNLQKQILEQLREEETRLRNQHRLAQQKAQQAENAVRQYNTKQAQLKVRSQKADDRVEALQAELANLEVEDGVLDALKRELEDAEEDVKLYGDAYGNSALEKEDLNRKAHEKKQILNAAKQAAAAHEQLIIDERQRLKNKDHARKIALTDKNTAIEKFDTLNFSKAEAESKVQNQVERVESWTSQAMEVCARVDVPPRETKETLGAKLESLTNDLNRFAQTLGGTEQEITDAVHKTKVDLENCKKRRGHCKEILADLKYAFSLRMTQFRKFQRFISSRSRINFIYLLSERAFRGKLEIDHKSKLLDVHVEPDETSSNKKGRETKTLSGGEKSFSSICLLLALWEAMGAPLRCLDEYDVFMDDVNRDVSTKMIISAARKAVGKQFILITPKALGNGIDIDDDVNIHKLPDPREKDQESIDRYIE